MNIPVHSNKPLYTLHSNFAKFKKKKEGVRKGKAFLVAIDEAAIWMAAKPGMEDAISVIALLQRDSFKNIKVLVPDNEPGFRNEKLL